MRVLFSGELTVIFYIFKLSIDITILKVFIPNASAVAFTALKVPATALSLRPIITTIKGNGTASCFSIEKDCFEVYESKCHNLICCLLRLYYSVVLFFVEWLFGK